MYLKFATSESQQVLAPENSLACVCVCVCEKFQELFSDIVMMSGAYLFFVMVST